MVLSLATLTTDIIADEGILDLFLNASWQNLLFFVMFTAVIVFGVNRVTKPQKEQNNILKDFAVSIGNLVKNNAVEERSRDERHEVYLSESRDIKERQNRTDAMIEREFGKVHADLKEINNTLIRHTATRCGGTGQIKGASVDETDEK